MAPDRDARHVRHCGVTYLSPARAPSAQGLWLWDHTPAFIRDHCVARAPWTMTKLWP